MSCDKCAQLQAIRLELWQALDDMRAMYEIMRNDMPELDSERIMLDRARRVLMRNMSDVMELRRRAVIEREQRNQEEQYDVE